VNDIDATEGLQSDRAAKVIAVLGDEHAIDRLDPHVERWRRDRIVWIALVGPDAVEARARVNERIQRPGFDRSQFIMTSAHATESLDEVTEFILSLVGEYEGDVAIVEV
jgi:hypothetical protein